MQTTYENFRYRYDKKVNPYNKGMIRNLKEVFLSKIPASLNDFQAFVPEDEYMMTEPTTPNLERSLTSSKEKIDIEMASKFADENGISLPEILQNLDYDGIEDNLKSREGNEKAASDPYHLPGELRDSTQSFVVGDGTNQEEKSDDLSSSFQTTVSVQS